MQTVSNELLGSLIKRLPELEWKIGSLGTIFSYKSLPYGLFRLNKEVTGAAYIAEIRADLETLSRQDNERSAFYLVQRIQQKINVLVKLCQMNQKKNQDEIKEPFGIKMISTRQQWINELEQEQNILIKQQQAMIRTLNQLTQQNNSKMILSLKVELGEVERRLTLAKEALHRAVAGESFST